MIAKKTPSGCDFLSQNTDFSSVFIIEEITEEQKLLRQSVLDFCKEEIVNYENQRGAELDVTNEDDKKRVLSILKKAGKLGFCGISIPEKYGGMGLDFLTISLISDGLVQGKAFATTIGAQTSIGSLPIVYYGSDTLKEKYLPKIASGEYIAAYALTEPGSGSDANSGKSKVTFNKEKDAYILNGQKAWITNGGFADIYVVFAKIEEDKNLSAFVVERSFKGFSVGKEEKKMGIKGSSTTQIYFENCKIPLENLVGKRNEGFKIALNILNSGRLKIGYSAASGSKIVLNLSIQYSNERFQFGRPISDFGAIKEKIAQIVSDTYILESALYRTAKNIDLSTTEFHKSMPKNEAILKAFNEFNVEASLIKVFGSEFSDFSTDEAIQIYGGMGYSQENPVEGAYRDNRITRIYEGTNEINRLLAIKELGKKILVDKKIDTKKIQKEIQSFILATYNPFSKTSIETNIKALKYCFFYLFGITGKHFKKEIEDQQEILMELANILGYTYFIESAHLRYQKNVSLNKYNKESLKIQKKIVDTEISNYTSKTRRAAYKVINGFAEGKIARKHKNIIQRMLRSTININTIQNNRTIANFVLKNGKYTF